MPTLTLLTRARFDPASLNPQPDVPGYGELVKQLRADEEPRTKFLVSLLTKLGLEANHEGASVPSLTPLHLTSLYPDEAHELYDSWDEIISKEGNNEFIRADTDVFKILRPGFSPGTKETMIVVRDSEDADGGTAKTLVLYESTRPSEISSFNFTDYYASLKHYRSNEKSIGGVEAADWGNVLLYGSVVTSTNTMLEKYDCLATGPSTGANDAVIGTKSCFQSFRQALHSPQERRSLPVAEDRTFGSPRLASSSCRQ